MSVPETNQDERKPLAFFTAREVYEQVVRSANNLVPTKELLEQAGSHEALYRFCKEGLDKLNGKLKDETITSGKALSSREIRELNVPHDRANKALYEKYCGLMKWRNKGVSPQNATFDYFLAIIREAQNRLILLTDLSYQMSPTELDNMYMAQSNELTAIKKQLTNVVEQIHRSSGLDQFHVDYLVSDHGKTLDMLNDKKELSSKFYDEMIPCIKRAQRREQQESQAEQRLNVLQDRGRQTFGPINRKRPAASRSQSRTLSTDSYNSGISLHIPDRKRR